MTARPARRAAVDLVCLVGTLALVLVPLLEVYGGPSALVVLVAGLLLGTATAVVGAVRRWSAITVVATVVVVFVLAGGPLAAPATTVAGVVPTPQTVLDLARGTASTWKQVLTLQPPVGADGTLLVAAWFLSLVGSAVAVSVALRARGGAAAAGALVPVAVAVMVIVLGTRRPTVPPVLTGLVLAVVLLPWAAWRAGLLRARRVVATGVLVAAALAAGLLAAPVVAGADRFVVRDELVPPFDPRDYRSPLSAFRQYLKEDAPLFTVTGLPEGARVRLATMDRYDGVVWNVAGDGSAQASGEFRRVGAQIETSARGERVRVEFTIDELAGVWLPTVGQATAFDVDDADAADGLRFNDATGAAVLTGGVRDGLRYTVEAVVPRVPEDGEVGRAPASDLVQPPQAGVPDVVLVTAADVARDAGSPVQISRALATWLAEEGYFSHGFDISRTESLSGHGADRITTLLGGDLMVGDGEQYAAAMALMVREMGLPARVVLGFVPEPGGAEGPVEVTGADVQAWVEVAFQGYGWVPFDATPPPEQTPQQEDQEKPSEPNPQVVQPPPPPPGAVTPPDEDTEQPQTEDPDAQDDDGALWRILRTAGLVALPLLVLATPLLVVVALKARRRRRRSRAPDTVARVAGGWDEVLDTARDLRRPAGRLATRNESARELATAFADTPGGGVVAARVGALARSADQAVFGPGEPSREHATAYWADVQETVHAMAHSVGWRRRMRARMSTASLKDRRHRRPKGTS
ncbi:transglutaminase-like domain-containing protein [Cellulomonas fengjieae]|uniref:Transglutaminase domain-containing protein n=1 Tax=Cellulomonas fengjieae TaxID=2819978 RepID=A0ABS3SE30_9CELL|nr:transglutaminase-like domain-containing protein [Cellulomonas fengjieae]MBO3084012.1 transglutaminase domain-containing protein [Cellulomonas fengjieae]QVI64723.1 transglutaminase domain-containing protein [Cellulomonas fengjieae]